MSELIFVLCIKLPAALLVFLPLVRCWHSL